MFLKGNFLNLENGCTIPTLGISTADFLSFCDNRNELRNDIINLEFITLLNSVMNSGLMTSFRAHFDYLSQNDEKSFVEIPNLPVQLTEYYTYRKFFDSPTICLCAY